MDPINSISSNRILEQDRLGKNKDVGNSSFQDTLKSLISQVDSQLKDANHKAEDFAVGKNQNLHEVMIASEKADISFQFLLQVRNKLLDAYQEIMRMNF